MGQREGPINESGGAGGGGWVGGDQRGLIDGGIREERREELISGPEGVDKVDYGCSSVRGMVSVQSPAQQRHHRRL